ncbi:MAG: hypothetical protein JNM41_03760 [Flavipsychrobacter sp.]|nr:hypothetical protein [Flavipsychrobacter sp.]
MSSLYKLILLLLLPVSLHGQTITTIAGMGLAGFTGDGGPATAASVGGAGYVCFDGAGRLLFTDNTNFRVRTINSLGNINTISGNGVGSWSGDGGPATSAGQRPRSIVANKQGDFFFADASNYRLRQVSNAGIITTFAGNGTPGFSGDGGLATAATLGASGAFLAIDEVGRIYLTDNNRIRLIDTSGIITTIAGTGATGFSGDGGPASAATFNAVGGIALDDTGNVYVIDGGNYCIRKINRLGIITTIAGTGVSAYAGDGGPALSAQLKKPFHIASDLLNNLYISENDNGCVHKISTTGIISTVVGDGVLGFAGDGGPATLARLNRPQGLAVDSVGNLYIGDASNGRLRKVSLGNGQPAFSGGKKQYLTVCENSTGYSLDTILSASDVDAGQTLTWQLSIAPAHGTATVSYSATSTGATLMPTGHLYTPAPGYSGTDTFTVRIDDGITANKTTLYVTVTPFHSGTIIGADSVCVTDTVYLSNSTPGGVWSSSASGVATINSSGRVVGIAAGTCQLSYTISNSCGAVSSVHPLVVRPWSSSCLPVSVVAINTGTDGIRVFPNPAAHQMVVEVSSPVTEEILLHVFDGTGRLLLAKTAYTNGKIDMDEKWVSSLSVGVYYIRAVAPHQAWGSRFLIAR